MVDRRKEPTVPDAPEGRQMAHDLNIALTATPIPGGETHALYVRPEARRYVAQIGFTSGAALANWLPVMDKFWSIFTMPIGVALVMLPAAIVWWMVDRKKPHPDELAK